MSHAEPVDHPPIRQRARSQFDMYGCKINRADLDRALALARQGFSPEVNITIETVREYGGISSQIFGSSIDEMLTALRQFTLPGDPDYLDNISMTLTDPLLSPANRHVAIYIGPRRVRAIVEGDDPGWVRGQIGGLRDIFGSTRARWLIPPRIQNTWSIVVSLFLLLVSISVLVISSTNITKVHLQFGIAILILALCLAANTGVFFANRIMIHRERTELRLLPDTPKRNRDWISLLTLIATILILAVGIITAVETK